MQCQRPGARPAPRAAPAFRLSCPSLSSDRCVPSAGGGEAPSRGAAHCEGRRCHPSPWARDGRQPLHGSWARAFPGKDRAGLRAEPSHGSQSGGKQRRFPERPGTAAAAAPGERPVSGRGPGRRHFQPAVFEPLPPGPPAPQPRPGRAPAPGGMGEQGWLPAAPLRDEPGAAASAMLGQSRPGREPGAPGSARSCLDLSVTEEKVCVES